MPILMATFTTEKLNIIVIAMASANAISAVNISMQYVRSARLKEVSVTASKIFLNIFLLLIGFPINLELRAKQLGKSKKRIRCTISACLALAS